MKIAIATPILFDATSPFNHLFQDMIGGFLSAGCQVIRYVAVRDDRENGYTYGYGDIEYVKIPRKESAHRNIFSRYLQDTLTSIREAWHLRKSQVDVLFEDVCYASFWTVHAAKRKKMRVVAMLQDIWPDNAVQSGLIKENGLLYRYFELWQRYVYHKADRIICISDDMKGFLVSKGIDGEKIQVIYNWGYGDELVSIPWEENKIVQKYQLKKDFYAVYAGNIGRMQNVELVIRAAKLLPDIPFLVFGDGAKRDEIEAMAASAPNVRMLPLQPPELAAHIYSAAGVNVIPLVEGGAKTAMPSKTGVVLSCGKPVIFCFGSGTHFAEIVRQYGAGMCVSATDENELAAAIHELRETNGNGNVGAGALFQARFTRSGNVMQYVRAVIE